MAGELTPYEVQRLRNIEQNKAVLAELGLAPPAAFSARQSASSASDENTPPHTHPGRKSKPATRKRKAAAVLAEGEKAGDEGAAGAAAPGLRRSRRLMGLRAAAESEVIGRRSRRLMALRAAAEPEDVSEQSGEAASDRWTAAKTQRTRSVSSKTAEGASGMSDCRKKRKIFGEVPGVPVGTTWKLRSEVAAAGIHLPLVAGIHGSATEGCYSIVLNGGYEDDVDHGEAFTFTGSGGRDLKGTKSNPKNLRNAPQSRDQELNGNNMALRVSQERKLPVRVVRGYKTLSVYAPSEGYRYDGLYTVERSWLKTGLSGYKVWQFAFKQLHSESSLGRIAAGNSESG